MTEGKVPHTVGVAYLDWRSQRWWRSLIFSLESSSFSHSHSCFCSHPLWALQWCSIPEPSMGWEQVVGTGSTSWGRAVAALLLCRPLLRTAGALWARLQGHPGAEVQAHPKRLGWMHAWCIFQFPSPPNTHFLGIIASFLSLSIG